MEKLLYLLTSSILLNVSLRPRRHYIGATGCSFLCFSNSLSKCTNATKDGDRIYHYSFTVGNVRFGVVCIKMRAECDLPDAERILISYFNKIKKPFGIRVGLKLKRATAPACQMVSIEDYWQDKEGKDWHIKGVTNGKSIGVLFVENINNTTVRDQETFLNSFRFS